MSEADRQSFADSARYEDAWRAVRAANSKLSASAQTLLVSGLLPVGPPMVTVSDCQHGSTLPGVPATNPATSSDATVKRAFVEATGVAQFYQTIFGRNSVDNSGKTLASSVHFSVKYNNAFWNGNQMTYGDGDGVIFIDFTNSNDVIAHELTHGVTQFSAQLAYANEAGGLNESMSDVFGSMYRQWSANQTVAKADWLIGKQIMGPGAIAKGLQGCLCAVGYFSRRLGHT